METKGSGTYRVQNLYIVMYKCKFIHNIYKVMYTYPQLQYSTPPSYYLSTGSQVSIFFFYSLNLFLSLYSHGYLEKSCIFSSRSQFYKIVLLKNIYKEVILRQWNICFVQTYIYALYKTYI